VVGIIKTIYDLPDPATFNRGHRLTRFASKGVSKLGYVHDDTADTKCIGRMRIDLGEHAQELRTLIRAVILCITQKKLLLRRKRLLGLLLGCRDGGRIGCEARHERDEGEAQAAIIGGVLAEGEFAVDFDVVDCGELTVFVGNAAGLLFELFLVLRCPPVVEVAVGVELGALVVEAVRELVADDCANVSIVGGIRANAWSCRERRLP